MLTFECRTNGEDYEQTNWHTDALDHERAIDEFSQYCYDNRDGWEWMPDNQVVFFVREKGKHEDLKFICTTEYQPYFSVHQSNQP